MDRGKRKGVSEAERMAAGISKMLCGKTMPTRFNLDDKRITFLESSGVRYADRCNWGEGQGYSKYCSCAFLKFETYLPDRRFLTRYSVRCSRCYPTESTHHTFCSYCNEVLTGYIAGPGGKIGDHLITIRHMYHEASALASFVRSNVFSAARDPELDVEQCAAYTAALQEWAQTIRFPSRGIAKREQFEGLVAQLTEDLELIRAQSAYHYRKALPLQQSQCRVNDEPWKCQGEMGLTQPSRPFSPSQLDRACANIGLGPRQTPPPQSPFQPEDLEPCERFMRGMPPDESPAFAPFRRPAQPRYPPAQHPDTFWWTTGGGGDLPHATQTRPPDVDPSPRYDAAGALLE
eukprot:CAMPEP_0113721532 /NCGR_PEP_ID=MMETSP0038_2-20120614/37197_1 /TAXON_ID=2898 /ORGANISM="Cryptomonas paramecium" /LENGTH=346 /DNA_ID=CAMNT_0000650575 /DNA_START=6 /DNA_END=1043 /DNA_ORIENTATION=- /assembly_acc=CAM_ASM_000170